MNNSNFCFGILNFPFDDTSKLIFGQIYLMQFQNKTPIPKYRFGRIIDVFAKDFLFEINARNKKVSSYRG